jgi:hypothetical protein
MENKLIQLSLNLNQVNTLIAGLGKLPLEVSLEIFNEIQKQSQEQLSDTTSKETLFNKVVD